MASGKWRVNYFATGNLPPTTNDSRRAEMPVEFIGMIRTRDASELTGPPQTINDTVIDPDYIRDFARAHEEGGFDRVLIGYFSSGPDGWSIASYAAGFTERLSFLIAHRPGFVAPTLAARK